MTGGSEVPLTGRVVVVGDLVTDVVAAPAGPLVPDTDTPGRIRVTGGGQGANTAAWLAHLGAPVTLVAAVGDDLPGRDRVAELTASGVDCAVAAVAGVPTGTLVVLSEGAERTMVADRGAADHLRPSHVDAALDRLADAVHLHLSGYVLLGDGSRAAGRRALSAARTRGLSTSVDASSVGPLRQVGPAAFRRWVRGVDLLVANAAEAAALPTAALAAGVVVVTLGADGAQWTGTSRAGDPVVRARVPAAPATAVDPTGAGDAFAAGLLASWLGGATPAEALQHGAWLAAEAVGSIGARPPGRGGPAWAPTQ